ncbi:CBN-TRY-7 protein [Caenorhabditis brenneri]|uniref:CBN-TRY-7 protein n=1 Tax=Caenorhabditis brenneri TaxID=135651 RepID=G0NWG3_CAEBE|nr:CBN-TRY-7 protein [Caenorhabditis brenneri]
MRWSSIILILLLSQLVNCDPLDKTENEQRLKSCGKNIKSKVFKGREAAQSEAPWSVFFIYMMKPATEGEKSRATVCTGTIVSSRHILLATHCIANLNMEKARWEVDGKFDQANCKNDDYVITDKEKLNRIMFQSNKQTIARAPEKLTLVNACLQRKPDKTTVYKNVTPQLYMDDFAIVDLYEELTFTSTAQMVCVAEDISANAVDTKLDYFGFGLNPPEEKNASEMTPEEENTGVLRHETVHVTNNPSEDYYFLATDKSQKNVACEGDSGGGAIGVIKQRKTIIGVLSQTNCEDKDKRTGGIAKEQYASVGYYSEKICKNTGICKSEGEYEKYHPGYVKEQKPVRKPEDIQLPGSAGLPAQNGQGGGVQVVHAREPDSAIGKNFILIIAFVVFVFNF